MAQVASLGTQVKADELTPDVALRIAWCTWLAMLAVPFAMFLFAVWQVMDREGLASPQTGLARGWFYGSMAYLVIVVPLSFFWRSHVFKAYWTGECVSPRNYLNGMIGMWLTIELGGLLALLGCIVTGSLLPNLLPALVAFLLFTPLWPSGHAMTRHCGCVEDPELYEEPR